MKNRNKNGFTLLELIVVIAIIGIMTSVGLVSLSSSKRQIALKTAQDEVTSAIKLAQSYTLQGKTPSSGDRAIAYGFEFLDNNPNSEYRIFYFREDYAKIEIERNRLKNGVNVKNANLLDTIVIFSLPSAELFSGGGSCTLGSCSIEFNLDGSEKNITINRIGLVTEN